MWIGLLMMLVADQGATTWSLNVEGMPRPQMRHHRLTVGARAYAVAPQIEIDVPIHGDTRARLDGPRYGGDVVLSDRACRDGPVLSAEPLPAQVEFSCLPSGAVVSCVSCPGWEAGRRYLPRQAPPIHVESWTVDVTFVFVALGFETTHVSTTVYPGANRIEVEMNPRAASRRGQSTTGC